MGIPNWPPPNVAVRFTIICRGNDVYRIESAETVDAVPAAPVGDIGMVGECPYLDDALEALGIEAGGAWGAYGEPVAGNEYATTFTAWRL